MVIKRKISKKLVFRLAVFAVIIGIAFVFDIFNKKNNFDFVTKQNNSSKEEKSKDSNVLLSQSADFMAKIPASKSINRKIQVKQHDRYIQKYYQLRNYQALKAGVQNQTAPLINSYHYLAFKMHFFAVPDDVPLIS